MTMVAVVSGILVSAMASVANARGVAWVSYIAFACAWGCGETVIFVERQRTAGGPTLTMTAESAPISDGGDPEEDLDRGLLLYLTLDESDAGATARDVSGNGHHGAPSEPPPVPSRATPPVGFPNAGSLFFDGSELLDLGNPDTLNVQNEVTVAAWIRPTALDGYRNIVAHGFTWEPSSELALRIFDSYYEFLAWDSNDHGARAPVPEGDVDNWHYLVGVYDGRMYRLYRDGELLAAVEDDFAPIQVDAPWAVGGRAALVPEEARPYAGYIDDVRIYGRALSPGEVRALFRR
jgi:Concanavalin A-like lectin/glucanases superfamily